MTKEQKEDIAKHFVSLHKYAAEDWEGNLSEIYINLNSGVYGEVHEEDDEFEGFKWVEISKHQSKSGLTTIMEW